MQRYFSLACLLFLHQFVFAQPAAYKDSLTKFQQNYVATHEVVKGDDRNYFRFYTINKKYAVHARFEKLNDTTGFIMKTSGPKQKKYYNYGRVYFSIGKQALQLTIYQSKDLMADSIYKNYLFIPFTDKTSGEQSYGGGRYLDFMIDDIKENGLLIDFNKAYNPYCAYTSGFNCPIPPAENDLPVAIKAGEMNFAKQH